MNYSVEDLAQENVRTSDAEEELDASEQLCASLISTRSIDLSPETIDRSLVA